MESRVPTSVDEEVASLSRSADRDSLFMQASVLLPEQQSPVTVRVRNLSAGGMLAEAKVRGLAQGAAVEVELRNIDFTVDCDDGCFGAVPYERPKTKPDAAALSAAERQTGI